MSSDFVNVNINLNNKTQQQVAIEKGCLFQNNGDTYKVDYEGKLQFKAKGSSVWKEKSSIEMNDCQWSIFKNVADNNDEKTKKIILSKTDINKAMELYRAGKFSEDMSKNLPKGYSIEKSDSSKKPQLKTKEKTVELHTKGNNKYLQFKFQILDKPTTKTLQYTNNPPCPDILNKDLLTKNGILKKNKYIIYQEPTKYTIKKNDTLDKVMKDYGIDYFELFAANPNLKYQVKYSTTQTAQLEMIGYLQPGDVINIPARYKIKSGSIKNLNQLLEATGVSKDYVEKIIMQIEPRKAGKPDLKAYCDGVNGKKGTMTIGFGHTGKYLDNKPLTSTSTITEEQAYEILAQDILNNKMRVIAYLEQHGIDKKTFDNIPKSLQSVLIDISFNKGIYDGFENDFHDYTNLLKKDLQNKDYGKATVHTNRLSNVPGLEKRSIARLCVATKDLSKKDKKYVKENAKADVERIIKRIEKKYPLDADTLRMEWNNITTN